MFVVGQKNPVLCFPMLLVGLTGGLASGKTTVARILGQRGAEIIDADLLAREVVEPGKPAWKDIVNTFGRSVLTPQGTVSREVLAKIVFGNSAKLKRLTNIIHPRVARERARLTRQIQLKDPKAVIVYDAAMLIEAGAHRRMDRVVVVKADRATQITRACQRGGLTKADALRRIHNQMSLRDKLYHADCVIDGTLPLTQLRPLLRDLYNQFQKQASHQTSPKERKVISRVNS